MVSLIIALAWSTGHIIFLGIFFTVVAIIVVTLVVTTFRTMRDMRTNAVDVIRWKSDFHDLPSASRTCRHEFTGECDHRTCSNSFDCNGCTQHARFVAQQNASTLLQSAGNDLGFALSQSASNDHGFALPLDRLYSRGHTWTKEDADGTYIIGIDDFASRLIGTPGGIELPAPGTLLAINGSAWKFSKGDTSVRMLSPIDGEVVETGDGTQGWYVRVKPLPSGMKTGHLLRGGEVGPWIQREFDRLMNYLADPTIGLTMPDGGMPIPDFTKEFPEKNWDSIYGTMFLEP